MGRIIGGFLDNDSVFGRIMTRCGIIIGANLMFILFSYNTNPELIRTTLQCLGGTSHAW